MAKGGARHLAKPMVDSMLLYQALKQHVNALRDLGAYERISRSHAVDASGLVHLEALIKAFLLLDKGADLHSQPLRKGLLQLYQEDPSVNNTEFNGSVWSNLKAERINVILAHLRKLAREGITASHSAKLNPTSLGVLQSLVEGVELRQDQTPEKGLAALEKEHTPAKGSSSTGNLLAIQDGVVEAPSSSKRKLEARASEVSVDSQGMPNMFASPSKKHKAETSPLEKGEASTAAQRFFRRRPRVFPSTLVKEDEALQKAMAFKSKEELVAKKKPAAKVAALPKAKALPKAAIKPSAEGTDAVRKPWVKLKKTCALKPKPRTYVTGTTTVGSKLKLICEVSSSMTPNHEWVIDRIMHALQTEHLTKGEALELRAKLVSQK